jgi:hypothetical protein
MISHKHKFIFIHIPKTAGMTLRSAFARYRDEPKLQMGHPYYEKYLQIQNFEGYHKTTCVRNPFDRLVSAFFYIKSGGIGVGSERCLCKKFNLKNINFSEFVKTKLESAINFDGCKRIRRNNIGNETPRHFQLQNKFIKNCKLDSIIRFENLQTDYEQTCKHIGIPPKQLPHKNKSRIKDKKHYSYYYDDTSRMIVERLYGEDLKKFNYTFSDETLI